MITSEHFALRTDLDATTGDELVRTLEDLRAAMLALLWGGASGPPGHIPVVALSSDRELAEFLGPYRAGAILQPGTFRDTMVIAPTGMYRDRALRHELGHYLSIWFNPLQPYWYLEGLPRLLERLHYDRDREQADIDGTPQDAEALAGVRWFAATPLIFGRMVLRDPASAYYMTTVSGVVVHYLLNRRAAAFGRFRQRLAAFEPAQQAWNAEFADLDVAHLNAELSAHLLSGLGLHSASPVPRWGGTSRSRTMAEVEVHSTKALLLFSIALRDSDRSRLERARAEVAAALRAEPDAIEALALSYYSGGPLDSPASQTAARDLVQRAAQAHPESWLAWIMVADLFDYLDPTGVAALAHAGALAPDEPEVVARQALHLAARNQWRGAVALSTKAIRLRATHDYLLEVHMAGLAFLGRCAEAAAWAATLSSDYFSLETAKIADAGWRSLRETCLGLARESATHNETAPTGTGDPGPTVGRRIRPCNIQSAPMSDSRDGDKRDQPVALGGPEYRRVLSDRIHSFWHPEPLWALLAVLANSYGSRDRITTLRLAVNNRGQVRDLCIDASSGIDFLDQAAWNAVLDSAPLPQPGDTAPVDGEPRFKFDFRFSPIAFASAAH